MNCSVRLANSMHYTVKACGSLTILFSVQVEIAWAVDTTYFPKLSPAEDAAIVQVLDVVESTAGTGFVIGIDTSGYPLALTNEHAVEGGFIWVKLANGKLIEDVDVLATDAVRDLAILRLRTHTQIPPLSLAPRTYTVDEGTPMVAVGASDEGLLHHMGTFEKASKSNHTSENAIFAASFVFTVRGFSGGPHIVVDRSTLQHLVFAISAEGTPTQSFGPWISEIHDWLDETQPLTGRIAIHGQSQPHSSIVEPDEDVFAEMFPEDDELTPTPQTPSISSAGLLPTIQHGPSISLQRPHRPPQPCIARQVPQGVQVTSVTGETTVTIDSSSIGIVISTRDRGQQQIHWSINSHPIVNQSQRRSR